jgi:xanthine dehydrogenase small subunit
VAQKTESILTLTINGELTQLTNVSPTMTLLEYLRQTGRMGTKEGCGDGDCGACTIALIAQGADGEPQYQAVNSCLVPLGAVAGRAIVTVEGVANGALHPVQAAMVQTGGSQCGYCTPGFIMSMFAAYYDRALDDVAIEGNLCRCTGYLPIREAAKLAAAVEPDDHHVVYLNNASTELSALTCHSSEQSFYRPTQLSDVFSLLQRNPEATLVAGATDLGLELSWHRQHYPVMISLEAVAELNAIQSTAEWVEIGAAVTLSHIEANLHRIFPSLDEMIHWFAARQVRNRATLGGNIGTASPIGDLPPVLLSLDAQLTLASLTSSRSIPLIDFFKGYRITDLQPGEVIVSIKIPKAIALGATQRLSQSYKIGKRGTDDISIVAAAFTVDLDAEHRIVHARLAYGGVAATPVRAIAVEQSLIGKPWNQATVQQAKPALQAAFTPLTDLRGSADYRRMLVANLFEKFFVEVQA